MHSRVARSNILAFTMLGARVTVCGPPTLIPRGMEALGCEVAYTLDGLAEADVVYALRMQKERMTESFVPSLREYAARYQIDGRRLGARQVLMHPGPVNRGVELAAEVIDSPQAVIGQQVAAGVVVRMAVLYELLAGRDRARPRAGDGIERRRGPDAPRAGASRSCTATQPPADLLIRGAHVLDPRAGIDAPLDVLVRDGAIAELGAPGALEAPDGRRGARRRGPPPVPRLRRPARAPARARPGAQGGPRLRHPRRGGRRLRRRRRDAEHRPGGRRRHRAALAARGGAARGAHPGRLPRLGHARARRATR